MTSRPAVLVASCAVAIFALVNATAATLGPAGMRPLLLLFGLAAVGIAAQTAALELAALKWALLFSMPPVTALAAASGSLPWLIGPLATLLLIAGELCALTWEIRSAGAARLVLRRRLGTLGQLGAIGLLASLAAAGIASGPVPGGALALVLGVTALAGLALAVFGRPQ